MMYHELYTKCSIMRVTLYAVSRGLMSNTRKVRSSRLAAGSLESQLEPELSLQPEFALVPVLSSHSVMMSSSDSGFRWAIDDGAEQNPGRGASRKFKRSNFICSYVGKNYVCSGRRLAANINDNI